MAYETAHARPSNVPNATGAKKSVVLGKVTQNGYAAAERFSALVATANGAARNGAGAAVHTPKPARTLLKGQPGPRWRPKAQGRGPLDQQAFL